MQLRSGTVYYTRAATTTPPQSPRAAATPPPAEIDNIVGQIKLGYNVASNKALLQSIAQDPNHPDQIHAQNALAHLDVPMQLFPHQ